MVSVTRYTDEITCLAQRKRYERKGRWRWMLMQLPLLRGFEMKTDLYINEIKEMVLRIFG
jgi:hypothetical protein